MPRAPEHTAFSSYDLLDAFKQEGCPICSLTLHSVAHYMESMNYDSVGDQVFRSQLKEALGFCNTHAHQWLRTAFLLGTAEIYQDILRILVESLQKRTVHSDDLANRLGSLLHLEETGGDATIIHPTASCPACAHVARTESMLVKTLSEQLSDPSFRAVYEASSGLCIPHLRMAFAISPSETSETLRAHALHVEENMLAQLGEIIRKHDYRFRDEPVGDERGAAERAVQHVAGADNIAKLQVL